MKTKTGIGFLMALLATALLNGCGGGGGGGSSTPPGGDTTPPSVGSLNASASSQSQINLSWGAATDNVGLDGSTPYRLFAAQGATPPASCTAGTPIYQGTGTSYSNTGLVAATQYSYRLCVFDAAGNSASTTAAGTTNSATGSTAGSATISTPISITNQNQAAKAATASVTIAAQLANSGVTSLTTTVGKVATNGEASGRRVMDIVHAVQGQLTELLGKNNAVRKTVVASTADTYTEDCLYGGTRTLYTPAQTGNQVYMSLTYSECKEDNSKKNGVFSTSLTQGSTYPAVFILGSSPTTPYEETFYSDSSYTTITEKQRQYLKMTIISSTEVTTATSYNSSVDMTMNGYDEMYDYAANSSDKEEFTNFDIKYTEAKTIFGGDLVTSSTTDMTMSGSSKYSQYSGLVISAANRRGFEDTTFQNFRLQDTFDESGWRFRMDGVMAYISDPECMSGTYNITTQVPITYDQNGNIIAGRITINGVVIVYNADGSITATLNGVPITVPNYSNVCNLTT